MKENQRMIDYMFKGLHKNVKYLAKDENIELLDTMVHSQLVRGNMYRDNSIVFHCGENAHLCKEAYKKWVKSIEKNFDKSMKSGSIN